MFQVNNNKNYENPTYKLTIKKDDEILYSDSPILFIVDSPTLANASLKANNKNLYLQTSDLSYIATRNAPIEAVISGLGFKDNKNYEFTFCYYKNYQDEEWNENNEKCEKITFKGKELNDGTAKIKLKEKIDEKAISYNFYVMCDLKESFMETVAIQGGFDVTFVDSKELFPNLTKYHVDNVEDLIKDISKNTSVEDFANNIDTNRHYLAVKEIAAAEGSEVLPICAELEAEIASLEKEEREMFLTDLGIEKGGLDLLVQRSYHLLGLISYLTAGKPEVRAWTITRGTKAPQAAGKIHSDFERGFIRAEVISFDDLIACGSLTAAKEKGLVRSEGKEYVMNDGDVVLFRFNV